MDRASRIYALEDVLGTYLRRATVWGTPIDSDWITCLLIVLFSAYGTLTHFMMAEDATVLFNHYNGISDAAPLFHYQGYVSVPQQILALAFSEFPKVLQPVLYSSAVTAIWLVLVLCARKYWNAAPVVAILALFLFYSDPIYFSNLTYSLWPSLICLALIGAGMAAGNEELPWWLAGVAVCLAWASPLSICAAIPLAVAAYLRRDLRLTLVAISTVAAFLFLRDTSAQARGGDFVSMLNNASSNVHHVIANFGSLRQEMSIRSIARVYAAFFVTLATLGFLVFTGLRVVRDGRSASPLVVRNLLLALFAVATFWAFVASKPSVDLFVRGGTRYYFPMLVFGAFLIFSVVRMIGLERTFIVGALVLLVPLALVVAIGRFPDAIVGFRAFTALSAPEANAAYMVTRKNGGKDYSLYAGPARYSMADCGDIRTDVNQVPRLYCGDQRYILLENPPVQVDDQP